MTDLYPMLIHPRYVERIWGGHTLAERLGKPAPRDQCIGESWEVYEENDVVNGVHAGRTIGDLRAAKILEQSEREILEIQRRTGFDWYWRVYFLLTSGGAD